MGRAVSALETVQILDREREQRQLTPKEEATYNQALQEAILEKQRRRPAIAERRSLEAIVGEELPDELFAVAPWGHRMIVVRERPIEATPGGVIIPKGAQRDLDTGWVVAIGDRVGQDDGFSSTYPGVSPIEPPEALLGMKVTFAKFAGAALFVKKDSIGGVGYESRFVCLTDGDIMFHHATKETAP